MNLPPCDHDGCGPTACKQPKPDWSGSTQGKPDWWPECPWPEEVWTATVKDIGKRMQHFMGETDTTSCSGTLMRHGWQLAEQAILERLKERGIRLDEDLLAPERDDREGIEL